MNTNKELSRRDFLRGAAVAAAGVTLAACAPAAAPTQVAPKAPTVAPPTAAPPPAEAITIQYWVQWGGTTVDGLKKCGEKFTAKSPGITTNIVGDADNSKILAAVAGGTTPEMGSNLDYLALIARGVCTPQTEWINASRVVKKDDFPKESWALFTWKGQVYGIPGVESAPRESLGYNVDLVEKAGLDPKNPPQTWDEVFEWHKKLTQFDSAGNAAVIGIDPVDDMGGSIGAGDPWMWAASWGFDYFDETAMKFNLDRPETAEILSTIKKFYDFVGVEKMAAFRKGYGTWTFSPTAGFPAGVQAMVVTGGWSPGWLAQSAPDKHFAYTWMPVSTPRKGKKVQIWGGHAPIIFKDSKHTQEAYRFAEYLTCDDEAANIMWEGVGFQPARLSWWKKVDAGRYQGFDFFVKSITDADEKWPDEPDPVVSSMGNEWVKARDGVNFGNFTPEEAATRWQEAMTKALQDMG